MTDQNLCDLYEEVIKAMQSYKLSQQETDRLEKEYHQAWQRWQLINIPAQNMASA